LCGWGGFSDAIPAQRERERERGERGRELWSKALGTGTDESFNDIVMQRMDRRQGLLKALPDKAVM